MILEHQIIAALILDSVLGDPRWLPHPVRMIGWLAIRSENFFRTIIPNEKVAGAAAVFGVLSISGSAGWWLIKLAGLYHPGAVDIVSILILYTCFAPRDLISHSDDVLKALQNEDLDMGRQRVGMIVGRDTATLGREGLVRAAVESVAENSVDGVTAPLFWAVVAGPVGALVYKAVNTLDSTFGHKNGRYLNFGWASARLDDLANLLPARLTGIVMVLAAPFCRLSARSAWRIFLRDRNNHTSPNGGQSEAPMAGALGIQLGGISTYYGKIVKKPTIGDDHNQPEPSHIDKANCLLVVTTALMAAFLIGGRSLICLFFSG